MIQLSGTQRQIIGVGVALLGLLSFWVPWVYVIDTSSMRRQIPAGYSTVFSPPQPDPVPEAPKSFDEMLREARSPSKSEKKAPEKRPASEGMKVDIPRVLIPMVFVVIATCAAVMLAGQRPAVDQKQ